MTTSVLERAIEPQTATVHDLTTSYRRSGEGAPLLFLHDAGLADLWLPLHAALAEDFDVIVPDHPGFGRTSRPDWLTEFADLVIHYAELLDLLDVGRIHLVGHGLGGWIAAEIAAFYPERLASLTLIAPAGLRPQPDERVPDLFRLEADERRKSLLGDDYARWHDVLEAGDPLERKLTEYHESIAQALISWNPRYDTKLDRRLARVRTPSLVLLPQHERHLAPSIGKRYGGLLANATVLTIEGGLTETEHMVVLQEPDLIAAAIRRLATVRSPSIVMAH